MIRKAVCCFLLFTACGEEPVNEGFNDAHEINPDVEGIDAQFYDIGGTDSADSAPDFDGDLVDSSSNGLVDSAVFFEVPTSLVDVDFSLIDDVRIVLTWDNPNVEVENPQVFDFSELDLHIVVDDGAWNEPFYDCNISNPSLDRWGCEVTDSSQSDPYSPSETAIISTMDNEVLTIGVFNVNDRLNGPATASVQIIINGVLRAEISVDEFNHRNFWDVAKIDWDGNEIFITNSLYPIGFP